MWKEIAILVVTGVMFLAIAILITRVGDKARKTAREADQLRRRLLQHNIRQIIYAMIDTPSETDFQKLSTALEINLIDYRGK